MNFFAFALLAMLICIVMPLIALMYFITRWRDQRSLSSEEENEINNLWSMCETLEDRLGNLERLLDQSETNQQK